MIPLPRAYLSDHDFVVSQYANKFVAPGNFVTADHIGYPFPQPEMIGGYIPDIRAYSRVGFGITREYVVEVETAESLDSQHTQDQWTALAKCRYPGAREFHVVVPRGYYLLTLFLLTSWNIVVDGIHEEEQLNSRSC